MAFVLHAVTPAETASGHLAPPEGTTAIVFRDLAAVVSEREKFALDENDDVSVGAHRAIVDAIFRRQVVLPTPPGVVFRTEHVLTRWMELHYVALNDAIGFVTDRAAMRVRQKSRRSLTPPAPSSPRCSSAACCSRYAPPASRSAGRSSSSIRSACSRC